ncbi:MAG: hypothetical protein R3300_08030, partial [Candidatus Promineifilaceae bacterium]|nr:hypothetical protein [Candidatus Promineifilaceae bacterium]
MSERSRILGVMGAGSGLLVAAFIGAIRLLNTPTPQLQAEWPGLLVFVLVYALPFVLALLAAWKSRLLLRAAVWLGAALLGLLGAFTAFSGVTLLFLAPAFLLAAAAVLALSKRSLARWPVALGWAAVLVFLGSAAF